MYFRIADNLGIRYVGTKNDSDDEDDIYGDLGDISLNTEHLDSAESAESNFDDNVQHESKNFSKPNVCVFVHVVYLWMDFHGTTDCYLDLKRGL